MLFALLFYPLAYEMMDQSGGIARKADMQTDDTYKKKTEYYYNPLFMFVST